MLSRQCLARRIASAELLAGEVAAWESSRNDQFCKVNWQFGTAGARIKLRRLYPELLRQDTGRNAPAPTKIYT